MNVLITGGTGLIGKHLTSSLLADGYKIWVLTRNPARANLPQGAQALMWDGRTTTGWGERVSEMDVIVNLAGATIGAWPWTKQRKDNILYSRVNAGKAVARAIEAANPRPKVLIQASGVGYYGPRDDAAVNETFPAGKDYLADVAIRWEASSKPVEALGVRRVIIRNAVVLAKKGGILPLMALPVRLFAGGQMGNGRQGFSWIHLEDHVCAIRFLMDNIGATGAYNLAAPKPVSNAEFMRELARALKRPYWLSAPAFALRLVLGEMSTLLLDGQYVVPSRLLEQGFVFKFEEVRAAFNQLFG
jgi:uncharacterized protein